jgi:hypothetical protein
MNASRGIPYLRILNMSAEVAPVEASILIVNKSRVFVPGRYLKMRIGKISRGVSVPR